ncbi:hypothetical protein IJ103_00130 [Candidatus Saccharibacteria bacterium]|nr:hypothetical protein [Candidatus Saccharibacteria bacterium]
MTPSELVELNNELDPRYRASLDEMRDLLLVDERYQRVEFVRGRLRYLSRLRRFKRRPRVDDLKKIFPSVSEHCLGRALASCGAWGAPLKEPIDIEDKRFAEACCRPARFRDEIEEIKAEGYEPPLLPDDMWERYIKCRKLHKRGLLWTAEHTDGHPMTNRIF